MDGRTDGRTDKLAAALPVVSSWRPACEFCGSVGWLVGLASCGLVVLSLTFICGVLNLWLPNSLRSVSLKKANAAAAAATSAGGGADAASAAAAAAAAVASASEITLLKVGGREMEWQSGSLPLFLTDQPV